MHQFPADWQVHPLGSVAQYINGYAFKPDDWESEGLPIIRIAQMTNQDAAFDRYSHPVPQQYLIDSGDLLFSWSATLMTMIWDRGPAILNQHIFKVVAASEIDLSFLHHLLDFSLDGLAAHSHGTTMKHIKRSDLLPYRVGIPRKEEQRRIAAVLDSADSAIQHTDALIAKLKQIKQGLLHDMLTRGLGAVGKLRDPVAHPEQFKEVAGFGRVPRDWDLMPFAQVASLGRGKFTPRPRNDPKYYDGRHPFIQTGDVSNADGAIITEHSQTLNELGATVSREFPAGTIAITSAANIADTAILGCPMFFPDSIVGAVVKPPHNIRFIELSIRSAKKRLNAEAPQSAQKNINLGVLRPLQMLIPHPSEQSRIAELYEAANARIHAEEAYRDKLRAIKQGLMQDLLTGRVRV